MKKIIFFLTILMASPMYGYDFTITIPNEILSRVVAALGTFYGYEPEILDNDGNLITNPETEGQFVQRKIKEEIKERVVKQEVRDAARAQRNTSVSEIDIQ